MGFVVLGVELNWIFLDQKFGLNWIVLALMSFLVSFLLEFIRNHRTIPPPPPSPVTVIDDDNEAISNTVHGVPYLPPLSNTPEEWATSDEDESEEPDKSHWAPATKRRVLP